MVWLQTLQGIAPVKLQKRLLQKLAGLAIQISKMTENVTIAGRKSKACIPVIRHANNAVFLRDDDRRTHNILESLDFAQQTWLPSLRLRPGVGCHRSAVQKRPSATAAPGHITSLFAPFGRIRSRRELMS